MAGSMPFAAYVTNGLPSNAVSVLSASELSSMISLASSDDSALQLAEQRARAELRAKSLARSAAWPNTVQAQRSLKKQQRLQRRADEEAQNVILDAEEAQFRQRERQRVTDRANALLYRDRDVVKNLQFGLNLCNINTDRRLQLQDRQRQAEQQRSAELSFHLAAEADRQAALTAEAEQEAGRKQVRRQLQAVQMQQLDAYRRQQQSLRADEVREGERRRAVEEAAALEMRQEEEQKLEAQRSLNLSYAAANASQLQQKAERRQWEAEEQGRIARYAEEKETTLQRRRGEEAAAKAAKAELTEKMLQVQYAHLLSLREREGRRLERQVEEEQERVREVEARKLQLRQERVRDETVSRQQQISRKREEKQSKDEEEQRRIQAWELKARAELRRETEAGDEKRRLARQVHAAQEQQIQRKQELQARELSRLQQEEDARQAVKQSEDEQFEQYAAGKISELQRRGLDVTPALLALEADKIRRTRLRV